MVASNVRPTTKDNAINALLILLVLNFTSYNMSKDFVFKVGTEDKASQYLTSGL